MAILKTEFRGENGGLFLLALRLGLLTFVTAGFYRFWARTRLRRWYWSGIRIGGSPLEYSGTGLEKVTGFFFALLILAVVLTAANLVGITVAINLMDDYPNAIEYAPLAFLLVIIPLFNFARYRARKYMLSRTSWRGIRFSMDRGAWGYAARASIYGFLTLATLGLFLPVRTFLMEKYLTDRTWYGNAQFRQLGSPLRLIGPAFPLLFCIWGGIGLVTIGLTQNLITFVDYGGVSLPQFAENGAFVFFAALACIPLAMLFAVYYRVASMRVLYALKELGDGVEFDIWPRTRRVIAIVYWGGVKTNFAASFVSGAFSGLVWSLVWVLGLADAVTIQAWMANPPMGIVIALGLGSIFIYTVLLGVFKHTFITFPMVKHISETAEIHEPELLGRIRQRSIDGRSDAGGFAEALDAGAAF